MAALHAEGEFKQCDIVEYSRRDWQKSTFLSSYITSLNSMFCAMIFINFEEKFSTLRHCNYGTKVLEASGLQFQRSYY